jgi:hypothetical protein
MWQASLHSLRGVHFLLHPTTIVQIALWDLLKLLIPVNDEVYILFLFLRSGSLRKNTKEEWEYESMGVWECIHCQLSTVICQMIG